MTSELVAATPRRGMQPEADRQQWESLEWLSASPGRRRSSYPWGSSGVSRSAFTTSAAAQHPGQQFDQRDCLTGFTGCDSPCFLQEAQTLVVPAAARVAGNYPEKEGGILDSYLLKEAENSTGGPLQGLGWEAVCNIHHHSGAKQNTAQYHHLAKVPLGNNQKVSGILSEGTHCYPAHKVEISHNYNKTLSEGSIKKNSTVAPKCDLFSQKLSSAPRKFIIHRQKGIMAVLKLSLMAFSFVFWAAGLIMLTIGIWAKISLGTYLVLSTNEYPNTSIILLATGTAVIIWGFLGCVSAATEHRCLLRTYGGFQLAVLAAGLAAGLSSLFYRKDIAEGFQNGLREAIHYYTDDEEKAEALDSVQRTLDCCGVESYRDWFSSPWSMEQQSPNGSVPVSCCRAHKGCLHSPLPSNARGIYHDGCFSKVCNFVSDNMFYIATAALGLALMQVVGIILACLLAARILPHAEPPGGVTSH